MKDIIIGIPSFNSEDTIASVTKIVAESLLEHFPKHKTLIVNVDGGPTNKTQEIFLKTETLGIEKIGLKEQTPKGKGSAAKTILEVIAREQATAGAVFDSDLKSITPEWVKNMLDPILNKGFDFAAPLYLRHKYDGTITNTLAYPLTSALYGKEIRQPIGGDFAFSGALAKTWLSKEIPSDFGIDIFMTTTALALDFKVCQVYLGPKIHDPKDPGDLKNMFVQVVDELFKLARIYRDRWQKTNTVLNVPIFGTKSSERPPLIEIDLEKLKKYDRISQEFWVRTIYDFLQKKKSPFNLSEIYLQATASLIFDDWKLKELIKEFIKQKPKGNI